MAADFRCTFLPLSDVNLKFPKITRLEFLSIQRHVILLSRLLFFMEQISVFQQRYCLWHSLYAAPLLVVLLWLSAASQLFPQFEFLIQNYRRLLPSFLWGKFWKSSLEVTSSYRCRYSQLSVTRDRCSFVLKDSSVSFTCWFLKPTQKFQVAEYVRICCLYLIAVRGRVICSGFGSKQEFKRRFMKF